MIEEEWEADGEEAESSNIDMSSVSFSGCGL